MKNIYNLLSVLLISVLVVFSNCGGDDGPSLTDQQERAKALSEGGAWSSEAGSVTVPDGVEETILDNLTLSFGVDENYDPSSFSSTGAPDFFTTTSSSTWSFSGVNNIQLSNVDGGVNSFQTSGFTESQMTLTFTFTTPTGRSAGGERISSLDGQYTLTMKR